MTRKRSSRRERRTEHSQVSSGIPASVVNEVEPWEIQPEAHQVVWTGLQPASAQSDYHSGYPPLGHQVVRPNYLEPGYSTSQWPQNVPVYGQSLHQSSSYEHVVGPASSYEQGFESASSYQHVVGPASSYQSAFLPIPGYPDASNATSNYQRYPNQMYFGQNVPEPSVAYLSDLHQDPYLSDLEQYPDPQHHSHPRYSYQSQSDPGLYDRVYARTSESLSDTRSRHGGSTTPTVNIPSENFGYTNDDLPFIASNSTSPAPEDEEGADSENASAVSDDGLDIAPVVHHTAHLMPLQYLQYHNLLHNWRTIQASLPADWQWDVEYHTSKANYGGQHGSWTCTPLEPNQPKCYPLTIAGAPVVLPVEYRWPPESGITPPPDPRATTPIDCRAMLPLELVKDLFLTFQDSIGFYILINGLLQVIVPEDYDTSWASSHLPHKYGGLKVCYIEQNLESTMLPSATDTSRVTTPGSPAGSPAGSHDNPGIFRPASLSTQSVTKYPSLKLNDFIEARPLSNHRKERFSGRVGLRVTRAGLEPLIVMSTHVITEAILAKSHRDTILGRGPENRFKKLLGDWNGHVEIWVGNKKIGTIDKSFDTEVKLYPAGFKHDITLIKPSSPTVVEDIASPVANLGWLHQNSWNSLRQQTSTVKILADTESTQSGKGIKCSRPSDVLVVGKGIFLNQKAAAGSSKSLKDHDASTWNDLVSRALLYRVYPDFDLPNGHSGTALYADGIREDGTEGPGIVGFQSFVQRSGHVQNFEMEGPALERRLQLGRVAFYGAFEVPAELKQYDIV